MNCNTQTTFVFRSKIEGDKEFCEYGKKFSCTSQKMQDVCEEEANFYAYSQLTVEMDVFRPNKRRNCEVEKYFLYIHKMRKNKIYYNLAKGEGL